MRAEWILPGRRAALAVGLAGAALVAVAAAVAAPTGRFKHLAVPVLSDPSLSPPVATALEALPPCARRELTRAPGRVTALLRSGDGALWVGTFDGGLLRAEPGRPLAPVESMAGRELFVNAMAEAGGTVWIATNGGLLRFSSQGRRLGGGLAEPFESLAVADRVLFAGGPNGVVRVDGEAVQRLPLRGRDGRPLRASALAVSEGRLWIGTPSGVYSAPSSATGASMEPSWHPLVFGPDAASTNVVTALAPCPGGVLAGTDDGGLVYVSAGGQVLARRAADPRANEVNPGAAATLGDVVAVGTQGGGLLLARAGQGGLRVGRPERLGALAVSAVAAVDGGLAVGLADGEVLQIDCR